MKLTHRILKGNPCARERRPLKNGFLRSSAQLWGLSGVLHAMRPITPFLPPTFGAMSASDLLGNQSEAHAKKALATLLKDGQISGFNKQPKGHEGSDFLIFVGDKQIPLEVKSGPKGVSKHQKRYRTPVVNARSPKGLIERIFVVIAPYRPGNT